MGISKAFVIHPHLRASRGERSSEAMLEEAVQLVGAIGLGIAFSEAIDLRKPRADTLIGSGHVERIAELAKEHDSPLVVVNASLSPVQQRNLEQRTGCKVIDRTALILEIFGARAMTHAGRLQVELAALTFQRSRLVRSWTHLERQRGGGSFLGGPGERQIELDRRLLGERVASIKKELKQVERTRHIQRGNRARGEVPTVALIGYTNAGKSTLFNRVTGSSVLSKDMLFATLDPTLRQVELPSGRRVALADTVGFISQLPTELVEAFKSTLEEVVKADLLVHVHDASSALVEAEANDVHAVLRELGLDDDERKRRVLDVMNKADLLDYERDGEARASSGDALHRENPPRETAELPAGAALADWELQEAGCSRSPASGVRDDLPDGTCLLSALTGEGVEEFLGILDDRLQTNRICAGVRVGPPDGAARAWLFERGKVEVLDTDAAGEQLLEVSMEEADWARFRARWPSLAEAMAG